MGGPLNQFTGASTATLEKRLKRLEKTVAAIHSGEDEGGGGSPLEGLYERIDDLEAELLRRKAADPCPAHHGAQCCGEYELCRKAME